MQLDAEEEFHRLEQEKRRRAAERRRKAEEEEWEYENQRHEKRREMLREAEQQGLDEKALQDAIPALKSLPPPTSSAGCGTVGMAPPQLPASATTAAVNPSNDHLLQLLGSQKLMNSRPSESERFGSGTGSMQNSTPNSNLR